MKQTDQGFVFTLGAQRKGVAPGFVSAAEIRTSNSGGSATSSVEAATLSPETRRRDFILDIGGTASGMTGVTVTIRQACVSFE